MTLRMACRMRSRGSHTPSARLSSRTTERSTTGLVENVGFTEPRPHQYEFARLYLDYTVISKRKLLRLVNEGHVTGWDDPRMPTLVGTAPAWRNPRGDPVILRHGGRDQSEHAH